MIALDAPKAGALPGCATPRTAEALRFRPDKGQAETVIGGNNRHNRAGTGDGIPGIVPEVVSEPFSPELREAWRRFHDTIPEFKTRPRNIQALRDGKSYVYFIAGEDTPIKIGFSKQPHERLAILQTAHWCRLSIVAKIEGCLAIEAEYHRRFAEHRMHGEWFAPHPDILAEIERLKGRAA